MRPSSGNFRLSGLSLAILLAVACDRQTASRDSAAPAAPGSTDSTGSAAFPGSSTRAAAIPVQVACAVDTGSPPPSWWVPANQDSLRALLDTLDRRIASATDSEMPALLLQRGRVRIPFRPDRNSTLAGYAKARPDEFKYNEIGGDYIYNGSDLRELLRRFPASELADDATYAMSHLGVHGECEGFIACHVKTEWNRVSPFLRAFPESPLADSAVGRAIAAFRQFHSHGALNVGTTYNEPEEARKLILSLDSAGRLLPQPHRARMLEQAGQLWERFASHERALSAYRAGLAGASAQARGCLEARLAAPQKHYFTLFPARTSSPDRVELTWGALSLPPKAYVIHRASAPGQPTTVVGRVGGSVFRWIDKTTDADRTYTYHVVAEGVRDTSQSNAVGVVTPKLAVRVDGIAVSTTSRHLHVFGILRNGFPQVIRVSYDGASVVRSDGLYIGLRDAPERDRKYDAMVEDLWLADGTGKGVLHFRKTSEALPDEIFTGVRIGSELLPRYLMSGQLLISLDEEPRAIWVTGRGDRLNGPVAMDCLAARAYCWMGSERNVLLRNDAGRHVLVGKPPVDSTSTERAADIFADPKDGSAWVFMRRAGRLVQIDSAGAVGRQVQLVPPGSGRTVIAEDFDRRVIWFTRTGSDGVTALARLDVDAAELRPSVVAADVLKSARMVPDLAGGVWLVNNDEIQRIDGSGAGVVGVRLNAPGPR